MSSESQELYLQKVEEFVYVEDKIVTSSWLSNELNISVKEASNLLQTYVDDQRQNEPSSLCISYILCGSLADDKGLCVTLAEESKLTDKEALFQEITSKYVFSVQKSKSFSKSALAVVDYFNVNSPKDSPLPGSIISKKCVKRVFKERKALVARPPTIKEKQKPSLFANVVPKAEPKDSNSTPVSNASKTNQSKSKQSASGIANFFSKAPIKSSTKVEVKSSSNSPEKENKDNNVSKKDSTESKPVEKEVEVKMEVDDFEEVEEKPKPVQKNNKPKQESKSKKPTKRSGSEKKSDQPNKKRRRIVETNDSDSDDIFGDDKEEENEVAEPSDDEQPVFKPKQLPKKNKKRKQVEQTTMDEDGFMVTQKVWVEESASEEEEEPPVVKKEPAEKKTSPKLSKKADSQEELATNGKGKKGKKNVSNANQPTLMSFFKKK